MRIVGRALSSLAFVATTASAAMAVERWYVFSLEDTPVGYVSEIEDDGRTETRVLARLSRLGKTVEMRFSTVVHETPEGDFKTLSYEMQLSKQTVKLEASVEGDRIRITAAGAERTIERGPERLLGPAAIARLTKTTVQKDGDVIEYSAFSPELQRPARVRRRWAAGVAAPTCAANAVRPIEESVEGVPVARSLWVDENGFMVADAMTGPFGVMRSCRAARDVALVAQGTLPADLYERTLARSNVRIGDPAAVDRIVLRVRPRDAAVAVPDLTAHNQRVLSRHDGTIVEIRRPSPPAKDVAREAAGEEFLTPNALIESADAEVARIAGQVAAGETDAYRSALALTRWVSENMTMDAGIAMAPASELVRDRKATCMGYATLLAALARADRIPSRVAMGYVYYGGAWGGHAWTEMWIDGRWLPFDAAVYAPGIASATRLAAGTSSFREGSGDLNRALLALFGRVDVETVELEAQGRTARAGQRPYEISDSTYVNAGLGVRVDARDYTIERADSIWPSPVVVAFRRGPNTIELQQRSAHAARPFKPADGTAAFVAPEGGTLWVWSAQGPDAARALRRFLQRVGQ